MKKFFSPFLNDDDLIIEQRKLDFGKKFLSPSDMLKIAYVLKTTHDCEDLNFSAARFLDEEAEILAAALKINTSVKWINLQDVPVSQQSIELILQTLEERNIITKIILPDSFEKTITAAKSPPIFNLNF